MWQIWQWQHLLEDKSGTTRSWFMRILWAESSVIQKVSFYHSEVDLSKEILGLDINLTQCMFRVPLRSWSDVDTSVCLVFIRLG